MDIATWNIFSSGMNVFITHTFRFNNVRYCEMVKNLIKFHRCHTTKKRRSVWVAGELFVGMETNASYCRISDSVQESGLTTVGRNVIRS